MKRVINLLTVLVMVSVNVFTPFSYAEVETGAVVDLEEPVIEQSAIEEPINETPEENKDDNISTSGSVLDIEKPEEPINLIDVIEPELPIEPEVGSGSVVSMSGLNNDIEDEHGTTELSGGNNIEGEIVEKNNYDTGYMFKLNNLEKEHTLNLLHSLTSEEIRGEGSYDGVKVEVYAQTGAFPSGTILSIVPITGDNDIIDIQDVLKEQKEIERTEKLIAFDISFLDKETKEELQPSTGTVQVIFNYEDNEELKQAEENEEQEVKVYHLNDKDEEGNKVEEIKEVNVEEVVVNEEKSEDENVMVIEADSFSIFAIIKSNLTDIITITYDPNGGNFSGKEINEVIAIQYYKNENGLYMASGNVQSPNRISEDMSIQSGYMFDGWYTTSGDWVNQTVERLGVESDTNLLNKTVYARWLPFNDKVITMNGVAFRIMDRNLGAMDFSSGYSYLNDQSNNARAGKYYQWGNNYGFNNTSYSLENASTNQVDASIYGPGNYYSNSTFVKGVTKYDEGWDSSHNYQLWGYSSLDSDRKGPCPDGYHVPRRDERKATVNLFNKWKTSNEGIKYCEDLVDGSDKYCLPAKLGLPFAGYRYYSNSNRNSGKNYIMYRSSSFSEPEKAYGLYIYSSIKDPSMTYLYKSYGLSVRCFKDLKPKTLSYVTDGGILVGAPNTSVRWWEDGTTIPTPIKTGYVFLGWYTSPKFEGQPIKTNVFGETVGNDITLYAKRREPSNDKMVRYDANGGFFSGGEETTKIIYSEKYISGYYVGNVNFQFPDKEFQGKTGYMFDGWYKDKDCTTEWMGLEYDSLLSQTVYAKWLPFEDLTVTLGGINFTIMDRNLGAEDVAQGLYSTSSHEDNKKLGKYYQWGNNYGFKNDSSPTNVGYDLVTNFDHANNPWGPGNYYYNSKFIITTKNWDTNNNGNLWGGGSSIISEEDIQGPCPRGYHIPLISERNQVKYLIDLEKSSITGYCSGDLSDISKCLASKLKLPFAGYIRPSSTSISSQGNYGYYWAANPDYYDSSKYFYFYQSYISKDSGYYRSNGYSLRCFKNSSKIKYNSDGGTIPYYPEKTKKLGENVVKLWKSIKEGYAFLGWYTTKNFQEGTEVTNNDILIKDEDVVNLYAKWEKTPWYEYYTNGGKFENGFSKKIIKYKSDSTRAYSHTPNVDDKGNKLYDYDNNLKFNEVINLGGAKNLHIKIIYGGESDRYDWVSMWPGSHPDYTANSDYSTSIIGTNGKLGGGNHTDPENTKEYYVSGDTVTFAYISDGGSYGSDGYGYYAIISNADVETDDVYYTDESIDNPQRSGYTFSGRYESGAVEPFDFTGTEITQDRAFYAKWNPHHYIIKFDINGGKGKVSDIDTMYGEEVILPNITRDGYIFKGWKDENGKIYTNKIGKNESLTTEDGVIVTLMAQWENSNHSSGGGRKSQPTASEVTNDISKEHNSADDNTIKPSDTTTAPLNEETIKEVISVTQEIAEDGTEVEVVVEAVAIKNTNIVATVRTETPVNGASSHTSSSSSTTHTQEQTDAYSFAKANGITTTESIETAKMNTELTRIQMAKMLSNFAINVLGKEPDVSKGTVNFDDVNDKMNEQYDNAVTKAYQLGIMGQNVKDNEFRPNDEVTRAEFTTALSRLLYKTEEGEYKGTSRYYIPHIVKLYNEGIVNKTDPKIKEKRGYVMTMLKRSVNK